MPKYAVTEHLILEVSQSEEEQYPILFEWFDPRRALVNRELFTVQEAKEIKEAIESTVNRLRDRPGD